MPTPTFFDAVSAGDVDAVRTLLDADIGLLSARQPLRDEDGKLHQLNGWPTPLCLAASAGHLPMVKLLLEFGADPQENARWGYPAVMHAHWGKHTNVVHYLLHEHEQHNWPPTYGLGIDINNAAREGWLEIVQKHLAIDPLAIHSRGVVGETPLHWAAHNNHADVCIALLEAGANVNADEIGCYGGKPLHWAAESHPGIVTLLLERGAEVDGRNVRPGAKYEGFTPLIWCASQQDDCVECAQLLINAGADVHAKDAAGRSALDWSRERGSPRVGALLEATM